MRDSAARAGIEASAEAAAQESQREEYDTVQAVRAQSAVSTYDPHADPLAAVDTAATQSGIALAAADETLDRVNAWNFAASPDALAQWVTTVSASSEYGSTAYGAIQATGAPDVASCGDSSSAWAPLGSGSGPEWLRLGYATPVYATGVRIHETYIGGFVTGLDLVEPNGTVHALSVAVDSTPCAGYFELSFSQTPYLVSAVIIHTQAPGWEEIDAVELSGWETPVDTGGDSDGDGISDGDELAIGTDPGKPDTDGDGLTDFQEVSLGTDPTNFDTDGDGLSDGEEVKPFTFAGKSWVSDPLQADSNKDGLSDMQERTPDFNGDGLPDDTDSDGVPDLYDPDNDGDGVPDRIDLSPFSSVGAVNAPFTAGNPFELTMNGLAPGKPTLLDFQVRPVDPEHLWYAYNVLDWPVDHEGQVQDWDSKTFADQLTTPAEASAATNESNGDMRLMPMLEVRIYGTTTHLPQDMLTAYNISLSDLTQDGTPYTPVIGKVAYVPLVLVSDSATGGRVAFSARIPYLPAAAWGSAHEMRMVWSVQVLTDIPCDPADPEARAAGCVALAGDKEKGLIYNRPQVVQSYDDAWYVTGANVTEEGGVKTAIAFEDPAVDTNLHSDDALWPVLFGLDEAFLSAADRMSVDDIKARFNRTTNGGITDDQRWGAPNILRVERDSRDDYASQDMAVRTLTMTRTVQILTDFFGPRWTAAAPITPTLLFAQEAVYRGIGLDDLRAGARYMSLTAGGLTVNFAPGGYPALQPTTVRSAKMTPFCAFNRSGPAIWETCTGDKVWDELTRRYAATVTEPGDTPELARGRLGMLQLTGLAAAQGASSVVRGDGIVLSPDSARSDAQLKADLAEAKGGGTLAKLVSNFALGRMMTDVQRVATLRAVGIQMTEVLAQPKAAFSANNSFASKLVNRFKLARGWSGAPLRVGMVMMAGALAFGVVASFIWPENMAARITSTVILALVAVVTGVIQPIMQVSKWASKLIQQGISRVTAAINVLKGNAALVGSARKAGIIGAVIAAAIAWGFFVHSILSSGAKFGSPEFNQGLAGVIATTIVIFVLAVLAFNPVGLILAGILALVDAIFAVVCAIQGKKQSDCFSITGEVIGFVSKLVYSYDLMTEIDADENPNLMKQGAPEVKLADPTRGFVATNQITVSMPVTTSIFHREPAKWQAVPLYLWFWDEDNIKENTFDYSITKDRSPLEVDTDQMRDKWTNIRTNGSYAGVSMYAANTAKNISLAYPPLAPNQGMINRPLDYYFNSGYAVPAYECWTIPNLLLIGPPVFPLCYQRTEDGSNSSFVTGPRMDIFPDTLAAFAATADAGDGGRRLKWDAGFPTLADADGDGLRASAKGGIDPDDARWDSDGDTLADGFELARRQEGQDFSPLVCDTDGDGLPDVQEAEFGANPNSRDTDNDGLNDNVEIRHRVMNCTDGQLQVTNEWAGGLEIMIAPGGPITTAVTLPQAVSVWVSSDATLADADADGIPDDAEYELAQTKLPNGQPDWFARLDPDGNPYNPNVRNTSPLQVFVTTDALTGFVKPGQTVAYTTTVSQLIKFGDGVLEVTVPDALGGGPRLTALPQNATTPVSITARSNLAVAAGTASGTLLPVLSTARARTVPPAAADTWAWFQPGSDKPSGSTPPSTDRALLFDGVNDRVWLTTPLVSDFTVAMWLKTTQPGTGQFWWQGNNILYGDVQGLTRNFGLSIGSGGKVLFGVGDLSTSLTGSRAVNDGQWHHVVATRNGVTGDFAVYVDGVLAGQNSKFAGPLDVSPTLFVGNLQAGVASFRGSLDFLTIYGAAMQADAVLDLYQGELPSDLGYTPNPTACVLGSASTSGFPWARIGLDRKLARGAGPLTSSAGINLTVDSDKPTTAIALEEGQFFKAPANGDSAALVIGGSTSDGSGVGVASVEVTANGVTGVANGTETWAYTIEMHEGAITVQSTAVDYLGNRGNQGRTATIYGDGAPPAISANLPAEPIIPFRAGSGAWKAPINANVNDPTIGNGLPGSGEANVEVLLQSADGASFGWQQAQAVPLAQGAGSVDSNWALNYEVPDAVGDPTGSYTVTIRAADRVGNASEKVIGVLRLVTPNMAATIRSEDADLDPITEARPLAGALTSVTGIGGAEAAFVSIDQILVISDTVLSLPLAEPAGSAWFSDATAGHHDASCSIEPCPAAGQPGRVDGAVQFSDGGILEVASDPQLDAFGSGNFTIQGWFKTGVKGGEILAKVGDKGLYLLWIDDAGRLNFDLSDKNGKYTSVRTPGGVASNAWTHVAAVVNRDSFGGEAILYINGDESAYAEFGGDASNDAALEIGIGFTGLIDDVMLISRALTIPEIRSFADPTQRPRLPVTLTPTGGTSANWQINVPSGAGAGLEGFHQLDLFVSDSHGNRRRLSNLWRGVIDTLPPRVTFTGNATGAFYLDPATGQPVVDIAYDLQAEDLHLDVQQFQALCTARGQTDRGYLDAPWVENLFPDLTVRNRLGSACHD